MTHISVCIATYNGGRFIREQLVSILLQIRHTDELIISDDSSTDDTVAQIRQLADPRIMILTNPSSQSPVCNFENALRYATGDVIFLSDQDDVWYPNKVEKMLSYLNDYDLVVSNCDFIDETGKSLGKSFYEIFSSGPGLFKNFIKNTFLGNCMAFRRSVLKRALPFPKEIHQATQYLIYQDVWFGLLANSLFRVMFIPEKLSAFRRHSNNASPTEMALNSPQSFNRKLLGRMFLALALLKRILNIA